MGLNFYKPLHFLFGEYEIETSLKTFSRFAALMTEKGLHFWGNVIDDERIFVRCSIFQAELILNVAKEAGLRAEISKKKGLPFLFGRYRKRYGLFVGLLVGMILLFYSQLFVWKITVTGNVNLTVGEIERALAEGGIAVGSFIPAIDVHDEANLLLLNCRELSSAAIGINGNHLTISVLERTFLPEITDTKGFYNVVASRDGVILDIDAADGTPEVSEGDVVFEGELLINSFMEGKNGTVRPTHARGIVYAAVKESFVSKIPLERITKYHTGNVETKKSYFLLGRKIPSLRSDETSFEYFDAVSSERLITLFGFIELPIKEFRVTYMEYIPVEEIIDESRAEVLAREEFSDFLAELDLEMLSCETEFSVDEKNGICILKADAILKQNIAKEVPFELISRPKG